MKIIALVASYFLFPFGLFLSLWFPLGQENILWEGESLLLAFLTLINNLRLMARRGNK